ncbi:protein LAZ1 homolog 1 isoform X3 [Cucumis sativus]|uniref:protein LAZ1 homolog 1 isoform X3 n=1 Tax=Cucumis sativus TaxID=3659 RepID=UPI0012F4875E|nr:protein LAZ1 homolog 1 isoform X3 [Cucumis sativus]
MGWRRVFFYTLFILFKMVESSSRSGKMWLLNLSSEAAPKFSWTILSAGVFVFAALVLSTFLIIEHLASYNQPEHVVLFCCLTFSVQGLYMLSVCFHLLISRGTEVFDWSYIDGSCLLSRIGGEKRTVEFMESQTVVDSSTPLLAEKYAYGVVEHPFPLNCFIREWYLGSDFYHAVKIGIVQYMILKMICALLAMILESFGVYGEGKFEWRYGYPYLAVVLNFSQSWALYCLLQFYSVTKDKLESIKPLAKFLVVKSIVFLTWWQGVAVAFLFSIGAFKGSLARELKTRIQDYLICIEMGIAAVAHVYTFPAVPYKRGERCVRNVSVLSDYASLGTPPDPEEVQDSERTTKIRLGRHDEREKRLNFPQSVRDVVIGSGEIIVDDMKYTVTHVVEPVERGIAKLNKTIHRFSENVKRHEEQRKSAKDDSHLIPLNSWSKEFSEVEENITQGSVSDSGITNGKRQHSQSKATTSRIRFGR